MTDYTKIAKKAIDEMKASGLTESSAVLNISTKYELNVDADQLSLYRTTNNINLQMTGLINKQKGSASANDISEASIKQLAQEVYTTAESNEADNANSIAPAQPHEQQTFGADKPDSTAMIQRLKEFTEYVHKTYPAIKLIQCILHFTKTRNIYVNSNDVCFDQTSGCYNFSAMFSATSGGKSSSINYSGGTMLDLSKPLHEWSDLDLVLKQTTEQIETKPLDASFVGDMVIMPLVVADLVPTLLNSFTSEMPLISKTSPWQNSLDKKVLSDKITMRCEPCEPTQLPAARTLFTNDGFKTANEKVIDRGVLKTFLLGHYGSNKTGFPRCKSDFNAFSIDAGSTPVDRMIASVKKGILLGRFSGGQPASNGDFSGVAKNSYLIEDGKIVCPISETMIAGNLEKIFNDVVAVSSERIDYGNALLPWIHVSGVTISGK